MSFQSLIIHFKADLKELSLIMKWVKENSKSAGFDEKQMRRIELAMEEALVNVILHSGLKVNEEIELSCHLEVKKSIKFSIKNKGVLFNPLLSKTPLDSNKELEARKEGGLGILLMKKFMDELLYVREEPYNILHLTKKFTS